MPTSVPQMVDQTISVEPDGPRLRAMQKYLQKAGMLPSAARSSGSPQVEAIHAAIWLLALLVGGRQTHVTHAVYTAYIMPPRDRKGWRNPALQDELSSDHCLARHTGSTDRIASAGELMYLLISLAAEGRESREWVRKTFSEIEVSHDGRMICFRLRDGSAEYYELRGGITRSGPDGKGPLLETSSRARIEFLLALADMVAQTRIDAARRGITVPVDSAFKALGYETPPTPPTSERVSGSASKENSDPETMKAIGAGTPTALVHGQPAKKQAAPLNEAHSTEKEGGLQSPPDRRAGRSSSTAGDRHGEESAPPLAA